MADKVPLSALDLFRRWHNRYPRIEMGRIGFREGLVEAGRFYLQPQRAGKSLGFKTIQLGYPVIDVNKAGLDASISFKSESGIDPKIQMENAYWELIQEHFLSGRRFTLHFYEPMVPSWYNVPIRTKPEFPVQFKIHPALKRGMIINPRDQEARGYLHWSAFIPEGTPEHDAIVAANDLAEIVHKDGLKPTEAQIKELQDILWAKIALVPN